ncbi:cytochrome P450-like protein 25 [Sarcoptes scabiei]|uniref:Cytochrome P450-like protein 25 n=1 Tax=Sarcoptes scabiei TaxID=52283 RepID=A0A132AK25_SARSC|nr:cytochrome P450-like protein 25 [Sarcoptes scabiei]
MELERKLFKKVSGTKYLSDDEILAQSVLFFQVGYDTAAKTLKHLFYELTLNEKIQERLYREIDDAFRSKPDSIDYDIVIDLPYLNAIISETLRKYPSALIMGREAADDYRVDEYNLTIEKGTGIIISIYAIHHNPEYYPEPERFDPERFMPGNLEKIIPYTYLPFGGGPRNCIGMRFVMTEMKLCVARLIHTFRFVRTSRTSDRLKILNDLLFLNTSPVYIGAERRSRTRTKDKNNFSTIENIGIRPLDTVQMAIKNQIAPNRFAFNTVINTMGECNCRFGWTGMFCQDCLTLPGCVHGVCHRPFECKCEEGWNGVFCSIPKCRDGCHSKNGYCTKPNECKCKLGWRGENCTECAVLPGCQHGSCTDPLDCDCEKGWQGTFCSQPICSEGCQNGWCLKPNECRCKIGFNGTNCDQCVPYPGCRNGHCQQNQPWTCECEPGWTGQLCDRRLNRCEDHQKQEEHRCLNGGTCIDVEEDDDLHYRCQCSEGFVAIAEFSPIQQSSLVNRLDGSSMRVHSRSKRGLSSFFKRFWSIRKKVPIIPFQQTFPLMNLGQDYLFSQASSMLPFYNFNQVSSQIGQQLFPSFVKQIGQNFIDIGDQQQQQQSKHYLHPHHHFHHQQHHDPSMEYQGQNQYHQAGYHPSRPKYYRPPVNNLQYPQQYGPNEDDSIQQSQPVPSGVSDNENEQKTAQSDESVSKPSYYYPTLSSQQSQVQYQYSPEMIGTSPYTFHENPSQMNTFKSRPYGSNPGTLDVHKVLDQFIRSAGLSPKGDHDNVYNGNSDEKALSVKKLYTYPFYFSSSGDRPTSIRLESIKE